MRKYKENRGNMGTNFESEANMILGLEEESKRIIGITLDISEDYFGGIEGNNAKTLKIQFENLLQKLLTKQELLTIEEKNKILELIKKPIGRNVFASILSKLPKNLCLDSLDSFTQFGNLLLDCLNIINETEKEHSITLQGAIASLGTTIFTKIKNKSKYLFSIINEHKVWQDIDRWKDFIEKLIDKKIKESKEIALRNKKFLQEQSKLNEQNKGLFGKLKGLTTGVTSFFSKQKTEEIIANTVDEEIKIIINAVGSTLSQLSLLMVNYKVEPMKSKQILLNYGKRYKIGIEKLFEIQLEQQILIPISNLENQIYLDSFSKNMVKIKSLSKNTKINPGLLYGISNSIKFVENPKDLLSFLLINKEIKRLIQSKIYKQIFRKSNPKILENQRIFIWQKLLNFNSDSQNMLDLLSFQEILSKLSQNNLPESTEELIKLDVSRSFVNNKSISRISLTNMLRVYAYQNSDILYCQGMNFIAGFLLKICQGNEIFAYNIFTQTIQKNNMKHLFIQDVPLLHRYFYIFDKLLFHISNELSMFLKHETITANFFTSSWFITVFTNIMQFSKDEDQIPEFLLALWDYFISDGWKAIFKAGIFILTELYEKIMDGKFETIIVLLGELPRSDFIKNYETGLKFRKLYPNIKISSKLIDKIGEEYDQIHEILENELYKETITNVKPS